MTGEISPEAIVEDLPEIGNIRIPKLREKVIDAWVFALQRSSFNRLTDLPGEGSWAVADLTIPRDPPPFMTWAGAAWSRIFTSPFTMGEWANTGLS